MKHLSIREFAALLFCVLSLISSRARAAGLDWPDIELVEVAAGFSAPTHITHAGDGSGRLFILGQGGQIHIVKDGIVEPTPFLDITDRVLAGSEHGLLSIAFSPNFAAKRCFYVNYSRRPDGASVVSRFLLSTNANIADAESEQIILTNEQPASIHCGGQLAFGRDGFLYISRGDGGYSTNAQTPSNLLGKILRIDVEGVTNGYRIPDTNPFRANAAYRPEIWVTGLRNPWRFSFDRLTGDMYIGDVGGLMREEINFQRYPSMGGQNYGWPVMEGTFIPSPTNVAAFELPIAEYPHFANGMHFGSAVIGGFVYRGPSYPRLDGFYFYCDHSSRRILAAKSVGTNWITEEVGVLGISGITSLGEDEEGNLYAVSVSNWPAPTTKLFCLRDSGRAARPVFDPAGESLSDNIVTIRSLTPEAVIHYTTNGTVPTEADATIASGTSLVISNGTVLQARTFAPDYAPSMVRSNRYYLRVATPEFNPPAPGPITNGTLVSITTRTPGATIRYGFDGNSVGHHSLLYTGAVPMSANSTLSARAFREGFSESEQHSGFYFLAPVARPQFEPPSGPIFDGTLITITCDTPEAVIYYTLDGSLPSTNSLVYTGPISINGNTRLWALATHPVFAPSGRAVEYQRMRVAMPGFDPPAGPITNGTLLAIDCATPGATIRYTLDGSVPDTNSPIYTQPLVLNGDTTVTARGFKDGFDASNLAIAVYPWAITAAPQFSPASGPITNGTMLSITCATTGAAIRYTTNGAKPGPDAPIYSEPVVLNGNTLVKARAFAGGFRDSEVTATLFELFTVDMPQFWYPRGPITNGTSISITVSSPPNAEIHYTLDGSEPDTTSSLYTAPLMLEGNVTLKAIAYKDGFNSSPVQSAFYGLIDFEPVEFELWTGDWYYPDYRDGPRSNAFFNYPKTLACNSAGDIYVLDTVNNAVRRISTDDEVSTVFIAPNPSYLTQLRGMCLDTAGNVFVATLHQIWRIGSPSNLVLVAGNGESAYVDGPAENASFHILSDIAVDHTGNVFVCDLEVVRKVSNGMVTTLAPAAASIEVAPSGQIYITFQQQIYQMSSSGDLQWVGGTEWDYTDGPRAIARFGSPEHPVTDTLGHIYVTDYTVRKLHRDGWVSTIYERSWFDVWFEGVCVASNGNVFVSFAHGIGRFTQLDWDGDKIPDAEEGPPTPFVVGIDDRQTDFDADGFSNASEYVAGTDPGDSLSRLVLQGAQLTSPNNIVLRWSSVAGRTYRVQSSSNLLSWQNIGQSIAGSGTALSFTNEVSGAKQFYRIRVSRD